MVPRDQLAAWTRNWVTRTAEIYNEDLADEFRSQVTAEFRDAGREGREPAIQEHWVPEQRELFEILAPYAASFERLLRSPESQP